MPIWPARSSTISTMRATSWSGPAPARRPPAWPSAAMAKALLAPFGIEIAEPRDRRGPGAAGARRRLGRDCGAGPARDGAAGLRGRRDRRPHEGSGGRSLSHRRYGGRRLRGGGARRAARAGVARHLGFAPRWAPGAGHRFHAGGEGRGGRVRRGRGRAVRLESAGHYPL